MAERGALQLPASSLLAPSSLHPARVCHFVSYVDKRVYWLHASGNAVMLLDDTLTVVNTFYPLALAPPRVPRAATSRSLLSGALAAAAAGASAGAAAGGASAAAAAGAGAPGGPNVPPPLSGVASDLTDTVVAVTPATTTHKSEAAAAAAEGPVIQEEEILCISACDATGRIAIGVGHEALVFHLVHPAAPPRLVYAKREREQRDAREREQLERERAEKEAEEKHQQAQAEAQARGEGSAKLVFGGTGFTTLAEEKERKEQADKEAAAIAAADAAVAAAIKGDDGLRTSMGASLRQRGTTTDHGTVNLAAGLGVKSPSSVGDEDEVHVKVTAAFHPPPLMTATSSVSALGTTDLMTAAAAAAGGSSPRASGGDGSGGVASALPAIDEKAGGGAAAVSAAAAHASAKAEAEAASAARLAAQRSLGVERGGDGLGWSLVYACGMNVKSPSLVIASLAWAKVDTRDHASPQVAAAALVSPTVGGAHTPVGATTTSGGTCAPYMMSANEQYGLVASGVSKQSRHSRASPMLAFLSRWSFSDDTNTTTADQLVALQLWLTEWPLPPVHALSHHMGSGDPSRADHHPMSHGHGSSSSHGNNSYYHATATPHAISSSGRQPDTPTGNGPVTPVPMRQLGFGAGGASPVPTPSPPPLHTHSSLPPTPPNSSALVDSPTHSPLHGGPHTGQSAYMSTAPPSPVTPNQPPFGLAPHHHGHGGSGSMGSGTLTTALVAAGALVSASPTHTQHTPYMQLRVSPNGHCVALCSVHHSNIIHVLSASEAGVCPQSWRLQHPQPVIFFQFDPNPHPYPNDLVLMTLCTDGVIRFWRLSSPHLPAFPLTNPALHWFIGHEMHGGAVPGSSTASNGTSVISSGSGNSHNTAHDYVGCAWLAYFERRYEILSTTKFLDPSARVLTVNRSGHVTLWHIKHLYERPRTNPQAVPIVTLQQAVSAQSEVESFLLSFCPATSFSPKTGIADMDVDDDTDAQSVAAGDDGRSSALVPASSAHGGALGGGGGNSGGGAGGVPSHHHFSWLSLLRMRLYALTSNHTVRVWAMTHHSLMPHAPKPYPAPLGPLPSQLRTAAKDALLNIGSGSASGNATPMEVFSRDFKFSMSGSVGGHRWVHSHQNTVRGLATHRSLPFVASVGADGRVVVWRVVDSSLMSGVAGVSVPTRGVQYECHLEEDEYPYSSVAWAPHHNDYTLTLLCGGPGVIDVYSLSGLTAQPRGARAGCIKRLHQIVIGTGAASILATAHAAAANHAAASGATTTTASHSSLPPPHPAHPHMSQGVDVHAGERKAHHHHPDTFDFAGAAPPPTLQHQLSVGSGGGVSIPTIHRLFTSPWHKPLRISRPLDPFEREKEAAAAAAKQKAERERQRLQRDKEKADRDAREKERLDRELADAQAQGKSPVMRSGPVQQRMGGMASQSGAFPAAAKSSASAAAGTPGIARTLSSILSSRAMSVHARPGSVWV